MAAEPSDAESGARGQDRGGWGAAPRVDDGGLNFQKGILAAMNENQRVLLEELRTVKHSISILERRTRGGGAQVRLLAPAHLFLTCPLEPPCWLVRRAQRVSCYEDAG